MSLAYHVITNFDLLKEIGKQHILQYTHFPDVFLEKFCDDKNLDKVKWLFESGYVTIKSLNDSVKEIFPQNYYVFQDNNLNPRECITQVDTFMEYILLYKTCPKIVMYVLDRYPDQKLLVRQKISGDEMHIYLQNNPVIFNLLSDTLELIPKKELKDNTESKKGEHFIEPMAKEEYTKKYNDILRAHSHDANHPDNELYYLCNTNESDLSFHIDGLPDLKHKYTTFGSFLDNKLTFVN